MDDLNLVGIPVEIKTAASYLQKEFEMKDLGKTKFCFSIQIEYLPNAIFFSPIIFTEKVLKRFHRNNAYRLNTPMVARTLDGHGEGKIILGLETLYLSAIGVLMYLADNTRPDIAFAVNLLTKYSSTPTRKHWKGVKDVLYYLRGTTNIGLFIHKSLYPIS